MSRRGDELDAEPAGIEDDIAQRVGLDLTAAAAAGADLAQSQRAAEQPLQFAVERSDFRHRVTGGHKVAAPRGGQPPIPRERDAVPRAPRFAIAAEDALAEIDLRPRVRDRQRAGRAQVHAARQGGGILLRVEPGPAAELLRHRRVPAREICRPVSLAGTRQQCLEHQPNSPEVTPLQIMAAIGKIEALVAQREVHDRLSAHRETQREPVSERRIEDFVAREPARGVGSSHVNNLAAPSLDQ